jgi:calcineurin-like phosphoesterase family protein
MAEGLTMGFVKKFYISDLHFLHERILKLQPRPFSSIDEHDEHIIANWNAVVGDEDRVYILGDFAMQLDKQADKVRWLFSRLKGRKYLVIGNHDVDEDGHLHPTLAALDWAERPEFMSYTNDGGKRLVLCHYGIREWQWKSSGGVHFYGHAHGKLPGLGLSRDVGVDLPDVAFTPRLFDFLTKNMKSA